MRREFSLPEGDQEFLEKLGCEWETIKEGGNWLLVHGYKIPSGYTIGETSIALRIEAGYPSTQIDMAYFSPELHRVDGKPIGALAPHTLSGKQWQRWSRHRTGTNPWRPEFDEVSTHLLLVDHWLEREFSLR